MQSVAATHRSRFARSHALRIAPSALSAMDTRVCSCFTFKTETPLFETPVCKRHTSPSRRSSAARAWRRCSSAVMNSEAREMTTAGRPAPPHARRAHVKKTGLAGEVGVVSEEPSYLATRRNAPTPPARSTSAETAATAAAAPLEGTEAGLGVGLCSTRSPRN